MSHRIAAAAMLLLLLCAALGACGGSEQDAADCPVVTPENVHLMTGNVPDGWPCTQDYIAVVKP